MSPVRATVVGAGLIGTSWTALFLAGGLEVTVCDPRPDLDAYLDTELAACEPALRRLGFDTAHLTARLRLEPDLARAVAQADVVQENGPERLPLKQELWQRIEQYAPADTLLATSTSGISATAIAEALRSPERLVVGHPFNPPHLIPLVEIVPGALTSAETVEKARQFYASLGKRPQVLRKEVPGFVANRLQSALFREAVHLVATGVVTEQELDSIVTSSIGLRWAVDGPFRSFHLGGGQGGLPDFLAHLGPQMEAAWPTLGTPSFDEPTLALLITQAKEFLAEGSVTELAAERDRRQIALMRALDKH
ncbi:3-hydroxyacyl-CoA dehydrogenase NAD-binding domain-containing protein [Streptomyces sp. CBMA123]|uniref:3-hydroxyacyl-CoA dehydrogenase NAD-binding domain-containing protein n=1 Tax=Streptomyces sp. CBMA123 TaxID=1896313 RepID=UPI0016619DF8|nr:3-hydroxyacyl-CoA dehydrogenase NAD-binding domain-containing protein [Streptomyces sp. CBMA123]MBD0691511.1 hydroxylacyl-CoA dehydrogenase [Streptomyces sp. CBMA123]